MQPIVKATPPIIEFNGTEDTLRLFTILTSFTCPYGYEAAMYGDSLVKLGWKQDRHGNFSYHIPMLDGSDARTMFTSHTDTASHAVPLRIRHTWTKTGLLTSEGGEILGADDKAGMTLLLRMAHVYQVPGHYHLFVGEERGCIGSRKASADDSWSHIDRVISFDRRGYTSIITQQNGEDSCSETFAWELAARLNGIGNFQFTPDPTGLYTDSYSFINDVPECTNVSVGYEGAHGAGEVQDIGFLDDLIVACAAIDWETLPVSRDPSYWPVTGKMAQSSGRWDDGAYDRWDDEAVDTEIVPLQPAEDVLADLWDRNGLDLASLQMFIRTYPQFSAALIYTAITNNPELIFSTHTLG
jgi:hypothetical protein